MTNSFVRGKNYTCWNLRKVSDNETKAHEARLPFLGKSAELLQPRKQDPFVRRGSKSNQHVSNLRIGELHPRVAQAVLQEYLIENYGIKTISSGTSYRYSQLLPSSLKKMAGDHINKMLNAAKIKKEDNELKGILMMLRQFAFAKYFSATTSDTRFFSSIPEEDSSYNDLKIQKMPIQKAIIKKENLTNLIRTQRIRPTSIPKYEVIEKSPYLKIILIPN